MDITEILAYTNSNMTPDSIFLIQKHIDTILEEYESVKDHIKTRYVSIGFNDKIVNKYIEKDIVHLESDTVYNTESVQDAWKHTTMWNAKNVQGDMKHRITSTNSNITPDERFQESIISYRFFIKFIFDVDRKSYDEFIAYLSAKIARDTLPDNQ